MPVRLRSVILTRTITVQNHLHSTERVTSRVESRHSTLITMTSVTWLVQGDTLADAEALELHDLAIIIASFQWTSGLRSVAVTFRLATQSRRTNTLTDSPLIGYLAAIHTLTTLEVSWE